MCRYSGHVNCEFKIESCISSSDKHILSGSENGNVYIWDLVDVSKRFRHDATSRECDYNNVLVHFLSSMSNIKNFIWDICWMSFDRSIVSYNVIPLSQSKSVIIIGHKTVKCRTRQWINIIIVNEDQDVLDRLFGCVICGVYNHPFFHIYFSFLYAPERRILRVNFDIFSWDLTLDPRAVRTLPSPSSSRGSTFPNVLLLTRPNIVQFWNFLEYIKLIIFMIGFFLH